MALVQKWLGFSKYWIDQETNHALGAIIGGLSAVVYPVFSEREDRLGQRMLLQGISAYGCYVTLPFITPFVFANVMYNSYFYDDIIAKRKV